MSKPKEIEDKKDQIEGKVPNTSKARGSKRRTGGKGRPRRKFGNPKDSQTNDPNWYSQSPELLRDSSSIPFSWPVGTRMYTSDKFEIDVVPGICRIDIQPTIGTSLNVNSPVNVAASAIYSWVRHANSGHSNYDAPDLMMYMLAMSNVYSFVVWMQRLYGMVSLYDQRNRYLPVAMVTADEVDFDDIRNNLANFRYFLNAYINKVASLAVPATMPIFNRLAFLFANIYCEGPSVKDQMYMYHPHQLGWYQFGLNSTTHVGELTFTPMTTVSGKATFAEIVTYANTLFNAVWDQEDFGIMSGDILKAYDGNVIKLSPVPEVMSMLPIYDAMVLHQMKNAKIFDHLSVSKISQNTTGTILQSILVDSTATADQKASVAARLLADKILSTDFDSPTPEVVIESTRLMPAYDAYGGVIYAGTEIPTNVRYFSFDNAGALQPRDIAIQNHDGSTVSGTTFNSIMLDMQYLSSFKYHPEWNMVQVASGAVAAGKTIRIWDIDNYAVLSNPDLQKMHETALLSLFAVPAIAKIS